VVAHPYFRDERGTRGQQHWHDFDEVDIPFTDLKAFAARSSRVRHMEMSNVRHNRRSELRETFATPIAGQCRVGHVKTQTQPRLLAYFDRVVGVDEHVTKPLATKIPRERREILEQELNALMIDAFDRLKQTIARARAIVMLQARCHPAYMHHDLWTAL
jgi:hypothetical protein